MKQGIVKILLKNFEDASQTQGGVEYWFARELQLLLGYSKWENFQKVVEKGGIACVNAGAKLEDHFLGVRKMVDIGSGSQREVDDISDVRNLLAESGIKPELLPAEDDIKKIERKVKSDEKKVLKETKKLKGE